MQNISIWILEEKLTNRSLVPTCKLLLSYGIFVQYLRISKVFFHFACHVILKTMSYLVSFKELKTEIQRH